MQDTLTCDIDGCRILSLGIVMDAEEQSSLQNDQTTVGAGDRIQMAVLKVECRIHGVFNDDEFEIMGTGEGVPDKGRMEMNMRTSQGPLTFSPYVLSHAMEFYHFATFPKDKQNIYLLAKQNGGYTVTRKEVYEDGGHVTVNFRYKYDLNKLIADVEVDAFGFPSRSPVMTDSIVRSLPTVSMMTTKGTNVINASYTKAYQVKNGSYYHADVKNKLYFKSPLPEWFCKGGPWFTHRDVEETHDKEQLALVEYQNVFNSQMSNV